jgi:hypothetical protein
MGKGVIGGFKEVPKGGAELIKEDLESKLKRMKSELKPKGAYFCLSGKFY